MQRCSLPGSSPELIQHFACKHSHWRCTLIGTASALARAWGLVALCGLAVGTLGSSALVRCAVAEDEPSAQEATDHQTTIDFARDIRPLLSDRCFLCHGPDAGQRATDLRLDQQSSAHQLAIAPGDAAKSELMRRIVSQDPDEQMPPPDSNLKLSDSERQLLARWINEGAQYEQHWAFVTPTRPTLPAVEQEDWPRGDLDRLVLHLSLIHISEPTRPY